MDNYKILLVEDDPNLGFVIKDTLQDEGLEIKLCKDGNIAFEEFYKSEFDLCILDVMLPKKDGFTLAEEIRKLKPNTPILFLTAKSLIEDKIRGFKLGADDYLTKPFEIDELILRIEAILKRTKQNKKDNLTFKDQYDIGSYSLEFSNLQLVYNNQVFNLTRKEAELLRLLCIYKNKVLERSVALNTIWGNDDYFLGRSMDVFISKIRKHLSNDTNIEIINVHGVGFKLIVNEK